MRINFGPSAGYSTSHLLLNDPRYVKELLEATNLDPHLEAVRQNLLLKIQQFDAKKFAEPCRELDCPDIARISDMALVLAPVDYDPDFEETEIVGFWCETCCRKSLARGHALEFRTYQDAMNYLAAIPIASEVDNSWMLMERFFKAKGLTSSASIDKFLP